MFKSRAVLSAFVLTLLAGAVQSASAQLSNAGLPPFGSFNFDPDSFATTNLASLNVHFDVPLRSLPGRGLPFDVHMGADASRLGPPGYIGISGTPVWTGTGTQYPIVTPIVGNFAVYGLKPGYIPLSSVLLNCYSSNQTFLGNYTVYSNFSYLDNKGGVHYYSSNLQVATYATDSNGNSIICPTFNGTPGDYGPTDGSSYTLHIRNGNQAGQPWVTDASNGVKNDYIDLNGNQTTQSGVTTYDSSGNAALSVSSTSSAWTFSYTGPDGNPKNIVATLGTVSGTDAIGCPSIADQAYSGRPVVTRIDLPDGRFYTFTYDPVLSRPQTIKLPSGGVVTYTYNGPNNGVSCEDGGTSGFTKTTPDGTWNYSRTYNPTSKLWTTTVVDPQGSQTIYTFSPRDFTATGSGGIAQYEVQRLVYGNVGGTQTLLKKVVTCYNRNYTSCATAVNPTAGGAPFQKDIYTYLPGVTNPSLSEIVFQDASTLREDKEYNFGAAVPPGNNFVRDRNIVYYGFGCPQSDTTTDSTGRVLAQANYQCDAYAHPLSESRLITGSTFATTSHTYTSAGLVKTTTDPGGTQTVYTYGQCNGAFPTLITTSVLSQTLNWNCAGEVKTSVTDSNNKTTAFSYYASNGTADPYWRVGKTVYPDGGQFNIDYNLSASPPNIETSKKVDASHALTTHTNLDGLGRPVKWTLTSDPGGIDIVDTAYDSLGRKSSVTSPYRQGQTNYGGTTYTYDALGRMKVLTHLDDSSSQKWSYIGNSVVFTDENQSKWQRTFDALGRLTQVLEPTATVQTPTLTTNYTYDGLDNLLTVSQRGTSAGANPDVPHNRSFSYDALSRLKCSANPEIKTPAVCPTVDTGSRPSGTIYYNYNPTGTISSRVGPRPNATSNGALTTASYLYDALSRLKSVTYDDGSPTRSFGYDTSSVQGANAIGRLTSETTIDPATSAVLSQRNYLTFDPMGRVWDESQCAAPNCASSIFFTPQYAYNLAGDVSLSSDGNGSVPFALSYAYDGADHLSSITSDMADANHPPTLMRPPSGQLSSVPASTPQYDPFGNLINAELSVDSTSKARLLLQRVYDKRGRSYSEQYSTISGQTKTPVYSFGPLTYDKAGNVNGTNDSVGGQWSYTYDYLNRLHTATGLGGTYNSGSILGHSLTWDYDNFGNRLDQAAPVGQTLFPTSMESYDNGNDNRGTAFNMVGMIYDQVGNIKSEGVNVYAYDAESHLCASTSTVDGSGSINVYDADGHRMVRGDISGNLSTGGSCAPTTANQYSPSLIAILGSSGEQFAEVSYSPTQPNVWTHTNVFANGGLLATLTPNNVFFAMNDWVGTKRAVVNSAGASLVTSQSTPYGQGLIVSGADPSEFHFTGQPRDGETGNDYFGARFYSSRMGRFLSPDPSGLMYADPTNPQSLNLYSYALDSPLTNTDPTGLYCDYSDHNDPSSGFDASQFDYNSNSGECGQNGGNWVNDAYTHNGADLANRPQYAVTAIGTPPTPGTNLDFDVQVAQAQKWLAQRQIQPAPTSALYLQAIAQQSKGLDTALNCGANAGIVGTASFFGISPTPNPALDIASSSKAIMATAGKEGVEAAVSGGVRILGPRIAAAAGTVAAESTPLIAPVAFGYQAITASEDASAAYQSCAEHR